MSGVKKPAVSRAVLDASALLALLFKEPGGETVKGHLPGSILSAVNLAEVVSKSVDSGMTLEESHFMLAGFPFEIVPFDGEHAYMTGSLRPVTRPFGLSLGDRACLALALERNVPAVTAERAWGQCEVGVKVIRIR
jgi:ribonuclease VapC